MQVGFFKQIKLISRHCAPNRETLPNQWLAGLINFHSFCFFVGLSYVPREGTLHFKNDYPFFGRDFVSEIFLVAFKITWSSKTHYTNIKHPTRITEAVILK